MTFSYKVYTVCVRALKDVYSRTSGDVPYKTIRLRVIGWGAEMTISVPFLLTVT